MKHFCYVEFLKQEGSKSIFLNIQTIVQHFKTQGKSVENIITEFFESDDAFYKYLVSKTCYPNETQLSGKYKEKWNKENLTAFIQRAYQ